MNLNESKIYKIWTPLGKEIYIGWTTETLSEALKIHRCHYTIKRVKLSSFQIFDKYGFDNCKIDLLEEFIAETRDDILKKQAEYFRKYECVNKYKRNDSNRKFNKDIYNKLNSEYNKTYREDNKEKIKEQRKLYREKNKDAINARRKEAYQQKKQLKLKQENI